MPAFGHHAEDIGKLVGVDSFLRFQRMLFEEADDFRKLLNLSHSEFPAIVMILTNSSESEKSLETVQHVDVSSVLDDSKFRNDL